MAGTVPQAPRSSFTAVAREQLPWLQVCARRLVGRDRAEDSVQECLLRAYRGFDQLRDEQAARAWFRQILLNCVRDRARREDRRPREDPVDPRPGCWRPRSAAGDDPWASSDAVNLDSLHSLSRADVWEVLDRIPRRYRAPLLLVHMRGHTSKEVARMFAVPRGTVLSWLHRGRKHFERELWAYAAEHDLLSDASGPPR